MRGVVFSVVKNKLGIYGFINAGGKKYYYNTNGVARGVYVKKGLLVDFDVVVQTDGREKAINITKAEKQLIEEKLMLSDSQKCDVLMKINEAIGSNGFVPAATIPYVLEKIGIDNFRKYAESIEEFVTEYFSQTLVFGRNIKYGDKNYPGIVAKKEWLSTMQMQDNKKISSEELTEEDDTTVNIEEVIQAIDKRIEDAILANGFLLQSVIPSILSDFGIEYKDYAVNLNEFINRYFLKKYALKNNWEIAGKTFTNVLVITNDDDEKIVESGIDNTELLNYELLDGLYEDKKYYEYLQLLQSQRMSLDKIPEVYIEKAIYSAENLLETYSSKQALNFFQKELLFSRTSKNFIYNWKKPTGYQNTILANYEKSSIVNVSIPEDVGLITNLINNVGADNKVNNSFASVVSRFEFCMDSLVFILYMIRSCAPISQKKLEKIVCDYCKFIKNLKINAIAKRIDFQHIVMIFEKYLTVVVKKSVEPLSKNTCYNILSVYFDLNYHDRIPEVLSIICSDSDDSLLIISDFMVNYATWSDEQYVTLFETGTSLRIIEKICAYIWHKCETKAEQTDAVLNMLAHVLVNSNQAVIDEIIRLHISQNFIKKQKIEMLINSFHRLIENIHMDYSWFALASYIELNYIEGNGRENLFCDETLIDPKSMNDIRNWKNITDMFLREKIAEIGSLGSANEEEYLKLLHLFDGDGEKTFLLQKKYNDWYGEQHGWYNNTSHIEIEKILDDIYLKKVDYTFAFIYEYARDNDIELEDDYAIKYVESLLKLKSFDKVIQFVNSTETFTNEDRMEAILQVVYDNFYEYGLTDEAYLLFNDSFSMNEAISVFERKLASNYFSKVIALIILYAKNNELLKSAYLYVIYHNHAETGYTRLYSQYRSVYGKYIAKLHDHYDVIINAFYSLPCDELIDFLNWAESITIPNFSDYCPKRDGFSYFFDEILKGSNDVSIWKRFITHLYNHREIEANKWLLVVSAIVVHDKFNSPNFVEVHKIIMDILEDKETSKWPYNLIYYAAKYAVDNGDNILCEKIYDTMSNRNFIDKAIFDNPWCEMKAKMEFFVEYCVRMMRETSDPVYFNLLTLIKSDLTGTELVEFSSYSVNKVFLLNKICKYFIDNRNQAEAIALLENNDIWKNLTYQEDELLNAVKMLYLNADQLAENNIKLFKCEEDISRFKRDLANVLKDYPSQEELDRFDNNCTDNAHKLRIFSVVYGIFGKEELYEKYQYKFEILIAEDIEYEYMAFLKKCYISQLFYNSTYEYFYKLWRYFRLLLIACWEETLIQGDEDILAVMNKYHHNEMAICMGYNCFKYTLCEFAQEVDILQCDRKRILYCLISEDFKSLYNDGDNCISKLNDNTKELIGVLSSYLDFRDINFSLFNKFYGELINGNINKVNNLTQYLSRSFTLLIESICDSDDVDTSVQMVKKYMECTPNACVGSIISLDNDTYMRKEKMYISILCARQLAFKIFDYIRSKLISGQLEFGAKRYETLAEYLKILGYGAAKAQYHHILGMEYALNEDIENLKLIVSVEGIFNGIPVEWEKENDELIRFAYSANSEKFKPLRSIAYIGAGQSKKGKISFVKELCELYNLEQVDEEEAVLTELEREYNNLNSDSKERIISGLRLLQISDSSLKNIEKPSELEVGLLIASKDSFASANTKLMVIKDLFYNGGVSGLQKQKLYEAFLSFYRELSLNHWMAEATTISDIVMSAGDNDGADEIRRLCDNINEYAPGLSLMEECPSEDIYEQLKQIKYIGQSIYSVAIVRAIEKKKYEIEKSVRLKVIIENAKEKENRIVNDGYLYLCIKNIGSTSINVYEEAEIDVYLSSQDGAKYTPVRGVVSGIKELRPRWLTGCRVNIKNLIENVNAGTLLEANVLVRVNGKLICSQKEKLMVGKSVKLDELPEPIRNGYYVRLAVGDNEAEHKLYGRNEEKKDIKYAISTGKAVIFGPSRIGKTSLINWVRHSYAKEKENVISILMGGEEGDGKENDYEKNIRTKSELCYDNSNAIAEYLLVDMFIDGLKSKTILNPKRRRAIFPEKVSENDCAELSKIIEILDDRKRSIVDRYYDVDFILQELGYEVWLLFDEFQQVVEKWKFIGNEEPTEFIEVCDCINERAISSIKFVFCGSDELLRQMVLAKNSSIWRTRIFNSATGVRIGHIKPVKEGEIDEFSKMLVEDSAVKRPGLTYSREALETLDIYSDRVPLYAKEICNTVLEEIKKLCIRGEFNRNYIYSYDISVATQNLMELQNYALSNSLDEEHKARIAKIYDAVTKGLEEETDKQYLWVMAKWFMENPSKDVFDFKKYIDKNEYQLIEGDTGLQDRLEIACVRGVITGNEEEGYAFSTPFYYSAFCGTINNLRPANIFIQKEIKKTEESSLMEKISWIDEVISIVKVQQKVDKYDIGKIIEACHDKEALKQGMKELYGKKKEYNISQSGTFIKKNSGTNIGTQNNYHVSVQNITKTISNILASQGDLSKRVERIQELPRLVDYLPQIGSEYDGSEMSDTRISGAMDFYVADMEAGIALSFEKNNKNIKECWSVLGFENKEALDTFICDYGISQCFFDSLQFAYQLDCLFTEGDIGEKTTQIDYSPVTIMYCKLIESLLKEYHISAYSDSLPSVKSSLINKESGGYKKYTWGEIRRLSQYQKQLLTIGSFVWPIVGGDKSAQHITELAANTPGEIDEWHAHADFIKEIKEIRNYSAHGNKNQRVTLEQLDKVRRILIQEEGMKRLITIVKEKQ